MKRFRGSSSLRINLILLVFGVTSFAIIPIQVLSYNDTYQFEKSLWRDRQGEAAQNAARSVSGVLQRAEDILHLLSLLGTDELESDPAVFNQLFRQDQIILEMVRLNPHGEIIVAAAQGQSILSDRFTVTQSEWFKQASTGNTYFSDVQFTVANEPYLVIAQPASDGGVIAARLNMTFLWQMIRDLHFSNSGIAYVIDRKGDIVAHSDINVALNYTNIHSRPEYQSATQSAGQLWYGEYINLQGQDVIAVTAPVPGKDWIVFTELPKTEAFARSRQGMMTLGSGFMLIGILTSFLSVHLLNRAIINPIYRLRAGAEELGRGNLSHRINLVRKDEIGLLGQTFDDMAANLEQRNHELAENRDEQIALNEELQAINLEMQGEISSRVRIEEQLTHDAFHDALTGLPNRALFLDRLNQAIERYQRDLDLPYAVLFLDLDRFKIINDSLGHGAGDQLLTSLAQRLSVLLRSADTVARLGGDEFVILLEGFRDTADVIMVADRILEELKLPFVLDGRELVIGTSIGIVMSSRGYLRPGEVLRDADVALYRAKSLGKARYEIFDNSLRLHAINRLNMENELRLALEHGELFLHYQPIHSLTSNRISGFEALLRWNSPERGQLPPDDFISVAEETGLIIPIGEWVLKEACRQLRQWQDQFPAEPPLTMNVNISSLQFAHPDLVGQVEMALQAARLAPASLKLEITETALMDHAGRAQEILARLTEMGIQIEVDDFGTGYSSLAYLQRFPIHTIKIDRSFITRLGNGSGYEERLNTSPIDSDPAPLLSVELDGQAKAAGGSGIEIVKTIVALAHDLGMEAIAEGIETPAQLAQLTSLHCPYGQGFLFARPMHAAAAAELLANHFPPTP